MSKTGMALVMLIAGLAIGLIVGYLFFRSPQPEVSISEARPAGAPDVHQYFYRLTDTTLARHTITASDSGVLHRVDTVAMESKH